ncbi:MAG: hypothetical protein OXT67_11665 [Zetaproteobacteria bacterium]|nr:hypothetical protein [Zetaproteobacteria bacterium]
MISLSFFNLRKRLPCTGAWIALCLLPPLSFAQDQNHSDDFVDCVDYALSDIAQDEITAIEPNTAGLSDTPFSTIIPLSEAEYEVLKPLYQNTLKPFISSVRYSRANKDIKKLESFQLPKLISEIDENRLTLEDIDALRRLQTKLHEYQAFLKEEPEDLERHVLEAQYRTVFNKEIQYEKAKTAAGFIGGIGGSTAAFFVIPLCVHYGKLYTTRCVDTLCAAGQQVIGKVAKLACGTLRQNECIPSHIAGCLYPQNGANITSFFDVNKLGQCVLPQLPASLQNVSVELVAKHFKYSNSAGFVSQCLQGCSVPQHLCFDEKTNTILQGAVDASGCTLGRGLIHTAWVYPTACILTVAGLLTLPKYYQQAAIWLRSKRLPTEEMAKILADHHPHQVKQTRLYEELLRILAELRHLPLKDKA